MRATEPEHADLIELLGPGRLELGIAAGDHHDRAISAQHVIDQLDAALLADVQRERHLGEGHGVAQRQHAT